MLKGNDKGVIPALPNNPRSSKRALKKKKDEKASINHLITKNLNVIVTVTKTIKQFHISLDKISKKLKDTSKI